MKVYLVTPKYDEFKSYDLKNPSTENLLAIMCKGKEVNLSKPLEIVTDEEDIGLNEADFGLINIGSIVLTEHVIDTFGEFAKNYGELIPLEYGSRTLMLWNVTNIVDALDEEHSEMNSYGGVDEEVFSKEKIGTSKIFKIKEDNFTNIYCTGVFKQMVEENAFSGLVFEEIDVVD